MNRRVVWTILLMAACLGADWPAALPPVDATASAERVEHLETHGRQWRSLAVWSDGRVQPLDSVARSGWVHMTGASWGKSVDAGESSDPVEAYLEMLLTWQGWDHPQLQQLDGVSDWTGVYFRIHRPDRWDSMALFPVELPGLKGLLKLPREAVRVSPVQLSQAKLVDPLEGRELTFEVWIRKLRERREAGVELSEVELAGLGLAGRFDRYMLARMGRSVGVVPGAEGDAASWLTFGDLLVTKFHDVNDSTRRLREAQQALKDWRAACLSGKTDATEAAADRFFDQIGDLVAARTGSSETIGVALEAGFNHFAWYSWAGSCLLVAALIGWMDTRRSRRWSAMADLFHGAGVVVVIGAVGVRAWLSGHWPWWGEYELLSVAGGAIAVGGWWAAQCHGQREVRGAAGLMSAGLLWAAGRAAGGESYQITELPGELHGNHWLTLHVILTVLAGTLLVMSLASSVTVMVRRRLMASSSIDLRRLNGLTERWVQLAVVVLAWSVLARAWWVTGGWGRDWSWSLEEVEWLALWLSYFGIMAARAGGQLNDTAFPRAVAGMVLLSIAAGCLHYPAVSHVVGHADWRGMAGARSGWVGCSAALIGIQLLISGFFSRRLLIRTSSEPALLSSGAAADETHRVAHRAAA